MKRIGTFIYRKRCLSWSKSTRQLTLSKMRNWRTYWKIVWRSWRSREVLIVFSERRLLIWRRCSLRSCIMCSRSRTNFIPTDMFKLVLMQVLTFFYVIRFKNKLLVLLPWNRLWRGLGSLFVRLSDTVLKWCVSLESRGSFGRHDCCDSGNVL